MLDSEKLMTQIEQGVGVTPTKLITEDKMSMTKYHRSKQLLLLFPVSQLAY